MNCLANSGAALKTFENKGTADEFHDPLKELADMGEIENAMIAKENIKFDVEISSSSFH